MESRISNLLPAPPDPATGLRVVSDGLKLNNGLSFDAPGYGTGYTYTIDTVDAFTMSATNGDNRLYYDHEGGALLGKWKINVNVGTGATAYIAFADTDNQAIIRKDYLVSYVAKAVSGATPIYYSGTGQNVDGAMTQKATSLGLGSKQNAFIDQVEYTAYNTGQTMPTTLLNKSILLYGNGAVGKVNLPTVSLADVGSVLHIYSVYNDSAPYNLYHLIPGNPNSTFPGGDYEADNLVATLGEGQTACLAVVKLTRPIPYQDSIAIWVVTSLTQAAPAPTVYYSGTGQNTTGAMTQKATTDAIAAKVTLVNVTLPTSSYSFVRGYYYLFQGTLYLRTGNDGGGIGFNVVNDTQSFSAVTGPPPVPSALRDAVRNGGNTWANGELQGTQPSGSLPHMKFCDASYRYEYMPGMNDNNGTTFVWCRTAKA